MNIIIYAVKGGIPSVGESGNPNFYLLCFDFKSNIGYIEEKGKNSWRLYTRSKELLTEFSNPDNKDEKFYHVANSFQKSVDKLQEITGRIVKVVTKDEVIEEMQKEKSESMNQREIFEKSFKRPHHYFLLSEEEQKEIDRNLGILDWLVKRTDLSDEDYERYKNHYLLSPGDFNKFFYTNTFEEKKDQIDVTKNQRIEEILRQLYRKDSPSPEEDRLNQQLQHVRSVCTHPEIGNGTGMFCCPDCGSNLSPDFDYYQPDYASKHPYYGIYDRYDAWIESDRIRRRKLKAIHTREEIIKLTKSINEKLRSIQIKRSMETSLKIKQLIYEKEEIELRCKHFSISEYGSCTYCNFNILKIE